MLIDLKINQDVVVWRARKAIKRRVQVLEVPREIKARYMENWQREWYLVTHRMLPIEERLQLLHVGDMTSSAS